MDFEKQLNELDEAMELVKSIKNKSKLVAVKRMVQRKDGKNFQQTFYVSPEEAKQMMSGNKPKEEEQRKIAVRGLGNKNGNNPLEKLYSFAEKYGNRKVIELANYNLNKEFTNFGEAYQAVYDALKEGKHMYLPKNKSKTNSNKKDSNDSTQLKKEGRHHFQLNGSIEQLEKLNPGSKGMDGLHVLNIGSYNERIYLAQGGEADFEDLPKGKVFLGGLKTDKHGNEKQMTTRQLEKYLSKVKTVTN